MIKEEKEGVWMIGKRINDQEEGGGVTKKLVV